MPPGRGLGTCCNPWCAPTPLPGCGWSRAATSWSAGSIPGEQCYIFQNTDQRIFFVIPYERDFSLIGTTDLDYQGDPQDAAASVEEISYLCRGASDYLRTAVKPADVVWTYSGVRPLYDDGSSAAQAITREYVLDLNAPANQPALLSVFGGKITTFRRLAEAALQKLGPHLPPAHGLAAGWTGTAPLPGGDFTDFEAEVSRWQSVYPAVAPATLRRLLRAYGTRIADLLGPPGESDPLGRIFGADLSAAELRYLARVEWAVTAADVVWRRSKLGLRLTAQQIAQVDAYLADLHAEREPAA